MCTHKKILHIIPVLYALYLLLTLSACNPVIGTPWYPRVAEQISSKMFVTHITVAGHDVVPVLHGTPKDELERLEFYAAAKAYLVTVPYSVEELSAADITVDAVASIVNKEKIKIEVGLNGETVPLLPGKAVPVTVKIQDNSGAFEALEKIIKVTRQEQAAMQQDLVLVSLMVHDKAVNITSGSVSVPYAKAAVSPADIEAKFKLNEDTIVIPVEIEHAPIQLQENKTVSFKINVKEAAGQYNAFEKELSVLREQKKEDEDTALQLETLSILGFDALSGTVHIPDMGRPLTSDDVIASFKDFGVLDVVFENGPVTITDTVMLTVSVPAFKGKYLGWNMNIRLIKDPTLVVNPKDKNGHPKYIMSVKTTEEEIDPFVYYTADFDFPASKFNEWVVYISDFNNSTNIASYTFKPDAWTGAPDQYAGPDFGSGVKAMGNVKFYRYKSRKDRWNGTEPPLFDATKEQRFYFYRFTASGGVSLDNSMFCVDTHSKFLFYYSEPATFGTFSVPYDWTDYAEPTKGSHKQFNEPFYLSDPVGFVKENGEVVLYSWIKENITNNNYAAQKSEAFNTPARKKMSEPGYSPYRDKIKKKHHEVIKKENPEYTVTEPVITRQPVAIRMNPNSVEDRSFNVRVILPPDGETVTYQWYENAVQSDKDGTIIANATGNTYTPDKTQPKDCYVYCVVTNTNSTNNKKETVVSNVVKLLIKEGLLTVDAELPLITEQPKGYRIPIKTNKEVKLTVAAFSLDKGELSYQWYKNTQPSTEGGTLIPDAVKEAYSFTPDSTQVGTTYYYCVITNTNKTVDGKQTAERKSELAAVEIEEAYRLYFSVAEQGGGTLTAICDGKQIETGSYLKKGSKVTFFAQANGNYEVLNWQNVSIVSENKIVASITIGNADPSPVVLTFRKIPNERMLTIIAKEVKNVDLVYSDSYPYAYYIYDFKVNISETQSNDDYESLWSIYGGNDMTTGWTQVSNAQKLNRGESVTSLNKKTKTYSYLPDTQYFRLNTKFVKYDNNFAQTAIHKQYLSDYNQSVIEFSYNRLRDEWTYKKVSDIPQNFVIDNVEVTVLENFVLKRGETKDFTINYYVANASNHAVGNAQVTYTLKWE